ncbi:MAG: DUF1995 family protein [Geminocystis sp.]|nr:DUF1995 family protein [Geminocystis sp.]HIK38699.1 DUF1995 family protein [Geminocystis sp. M7585_C2015_104]MCS7147022.1 DUF1995 family protein [Geminocystis sp.]MCX8077334.1 DUF1995 family protein [Geminocystis sp.]MDW8115846.1 DUF1995 family protein [Geminocystis sp.]
MSTIPDSLEAAISQAKSALKVALANGCKRITVDLVIPDISLKAQYLAWEFAQEFLDYGSGLKVIFPDTGAAALARRDWGETGFVVTDIGSSRTPVETKISDTDQIFLLVCPSSVEVNLVERLCNLVGDRPVVMLIPQLEDIAVVGIGYAARQLRERFINTLESAYYFRPLEGAVVMRQYPHMWQVWKEGETGDYQLVAEVGQKPLGETLQRILSGKTGVEDTAVSSPGGILASFRSLFRALNN